jgi:hypothetical protein
VKKSAEMRIMAHKQPAFFLKSCQCRVSVSCQLPAPGTILNRDLTTLTPGKVNANLSGPEFFFTPQIDACSRQLLVFFQFYPPLGYA